jgi:DNA repair exonuclease SbcCD ATPase subunit
MKLASETMKSEDKDKDEKLKNFNTIIKEIFNKDQMTSDELEIQTKQVKLKITRYDEIIKKIKEQIQDIDNDDEGKFSSALEELDSRLKKSKELEKELTDTKNKMTDLEKQLEDISKTSNDLTNAKSQIETLDTSIKQKDDEIAKLKDQIEEFKKEKESNDKSIDDFASNFDEKLKSLLNQIYGSESLAKSIIEGTAFNEENA